MLAYNVPEVGEPNLLCVNNLGNLLQNSTIFGESTISEIYFTIQQARRFYHEEDHFVSRAVS